MLRTNLPQDIGPEPRLPRDQGEPIGPPPPAPLPDVAPPETVGGLPPGQSGGPSPAPAPPPMPAPPLPPGATGATPLGAGTFEVPGGVGAMPFRMSQFLANPDLSSGEGGVDPERVGALRGGTPVTAKPPMDEEQLRMILTQALRGQ